MESLELLKSMVKAKFLLGDIWETGGWRAQEIQSQGPGILHAAHQVTPMTLVSIAPQFHCLNCKMRIRRAPTSVCGLMLDFVRNFIGFVSTAMGLKRGREFPEEQDRYLQGLELLNELNF